jgi:hypothetical protein
MLGVISCAKCPPEYEEQYVQLSIVSLTDTVTVKGIGGIGQPYLMGELIIPNTSRETISSTVWLPMDINKDHSSYLVYFDSTRTDTITFAYVRKLDFLNSRCGYRRSVDMQTIRVQNTSFDFVDRPSERVFKVILP